MSSPADDADISKGLITIAERLVSACRPTVDKLPMAIGALLRFYGMKELKERARVQRVSSELAERYMGLGKPVIAKIAAVIPQPWDLVHTFLESVHGAAMRELAPCLLAGVSQSQVYVPLEGAASHTGLLSLVDNLPEHLRLPFAVLVETRGENPPGGKGKFSQRLLEIASQQAPIIFKRKTVGAQHAEAAVLAAAVAMDEPYTLRWVLESVLDASHPARQHIEEALRRPDSTRNVMEGLRAGSDALCVLGRGSDRLVKLLEFLQRRFDVELPEELFKGDCPLGGVLPPGFPQYFTEWEEGLEADALGEVAAQLKVKGATVGNTKASPVVKAVPIPAVGRGSGNASGSAGPGPATPSGRRLVSRVAMLLGIARQAQAQAAGASSGAGAEEPERIGMAWQELWRVLTAEAEPSELEAACGNTIRGFQRLLSMRKDIFERTEDGQGVRLRAGASDAKLPAFRSAPVSGGTQVSADETSANDASPISPVPGQTQSSDSADDGRGKGKNSTPRASAGIALAASASQGTRQSAWPSARPGTLHSGGSSPMRHADQQSQEQTQGSIDLGQESIESSQTPASAPASSAPEAQTGRGGEGQNAEAHMEAHSEGAQPRNDEPLSAVQQDALASARLVDQLLAELERMPALADFVEPAAGRIDIGHLHPQTVQTQAPPHVAALLNHESGGVVVFFSQASPARVVSDEQRRMLSDAAAGAIAKDVQPTPPHGLVQAEWVQAGDIGMDKLPGGSDQAVFVLRVSRPPPGQDAGYFVSGCLPIRHDGVTHVLHKPWHIAQYFRARQRPATLALARAQQEVQGMSAALAAARHETEQAKQDAARARTEAQQAKAAEESARAAASAVLSTQQQQHQQQHMQQHQQQQQKQQQRMAPSTSSQMHSSQAMQMSTGLPMSFSAALQDHDHPSGAGTTYGGGPGSGSGSMHMHGQGQGQSQMHMHGHGHGHGHGQGHSYVSAGHDGMDHSQHHAATQAGARQDGVSGHGQGQGQGQGGFLGASFPGLLSMGTHSHGGAQGGSASPHLLGGGGHVGGSGGAVMGGFSGGGLRVDGTTSLAGVPTLPVDHAGVGGGTGISAALGSGPSGAVFGVGDSSGFGVGVGSDPSSSDGLGSIQSIFG